MKYNPFYEIEEFHHYLNEINKSYNTYTQSSYTSVVNKANII